MSVTFSIIDSQFEQTEETCLCAQMAPRFVDQFEGRVSIEEIRDELRGYAYDQCRVCDGTGVIRGHHRCADDEVNFSNDNARVMLRMMGLEGEFLCGEVDFSSLPDVVRSVVRIINSGAVRAPYVEDSYIVPSGAGRMAIISHDNGVTGIGMVDQNPCYSYGGRSDESIVRRAHALIQLFRRALDRGVGIRWS